MKNTATGFARRPLVKLTSAMVFVLLTAGPGLAQVTERDDGSDAKVINFCTGVSDADCYVVQIKNVSSATVMSTDFHQNATGGACEKDKIKVKDSVTGNNSMPNGTLQPYVYASFNANCAYEVKFNVTHGCEGDTRARVKVNKKPAKILLDKDCGTLKTIKNY
ncbi:MAG: hypothetical protein AAGL97_05465 [Pseudomonadota bacterium]